MRIIVYRARELHCHPLALHRGWADHQNDMPAVLKPLLNTVCNVIAGVNLILIEEDLQAEVFPLLHKLPNPSFLAVIVADEYVPQDGGLSCAQAVQYLRRL